MPGFRHLHEREVAAGHRLRFVNATFEAPDGTRFERDVIRNLEVVCAVPLLDDGRTVVLVRQYRGPVDQEVLELPAGLCDVPGEALERTMARELVEEVGREAGRLELLCRWYPSPGFSDQLVHLFIARDLRAVPADRQGVEEAHMVEETMRLDDVPEAIASGRLVDSKTILGLLLVREHLAAGR